MELTSLSTINYIKGKYGFHMSKGLGQNFLTDPNVLEQIADAAEIDETNSALVAHIFEVAAKLAKQLGLDNGFRVVTNCGESAGQSVHHIHFHLLGGRDFTWPPG